PPEGGARHRGVGVPGARRGGPGRCRGEPHALLPPGCPGGGAARSDRRTRRGSTMSGIQVVNQAEAAWLKLITDVDITLRLYTNDVRSEEHTSELQSRENLVCRLLLEKKKKRRRRPGTWVD